MRRTNLLATFMLLTCLFTATSRLTAQAAGGGPGGGASTMTAGHGCWVCHYLDGVGYCAGDRGGSWNCSTTFGGTCTLSSPGCGVQGMMPLDPDGAAQYVSRGAVLGVGNILDDAGPPIRRNCEGVVVARHQTPDNIESVRNSTMSLTL